MRAVLAHSLSWRRLKLLAFSIWAVGNEVSRLTAVETHPGVVVVVVGSDLASVALWGLHGVLVVVWFELGFGALRARGLGMGSVLLGGLEPGHGVSVDGYSCIKVRCDLQADKSPVVVKGPFFPRVVNPRYRIRGTNG
jgi:hypothetical protein